VPAVYVHLLRHGRVDSHRGDVPVAPDGHAEIEAAGLRLARSVTPGEVIHFLTTPTLRSRQTVDTLRATLQRALGSTVEMREPREEWAIRNPDLFLAGRRVEMVSSAAAMAEQLPDAGLSPDDVEQIPFYHEFFRSPERIELWLRHSNPPGEDATAVARRLVAFSASLLDAPLTHSHRFLCVTHSPVLRAVVDHYLGFDPGEPDWVESVDVTVDAAGPTVAFRDRSERVTR
jgi:broad specificity phosphatase PhoE